MGLLDALKRNAIRKELLRLVTAYTPLLHDWGVQVVRPDRLVEKALEVYDAKRETPPVQ